MKTLTAAFASVGIVLLLICNQTGSDNWFVKTDGTWTTSINFKYHAMTMVLLSTYFLVPLATYRSLRHPLVWAGAALCFLLSFIPYAERFAILVATPHGWASITPEMTALLRINDVIVVALLLSFASLLIQYRPSLTTIRRAGQTVAAR